MFYKKRERKKAREKEKERRKEERKKDEFISIFSPNPSKILL